jgi:hypothetical protein
MTLLAICVRPFDGANDQRSHGCPRSLGPATQDLVKRSRDVDCCAHRHTTIMALCLERHNDVPVPDHRRPVFRLPFNAPLKREPHCRIILAVRKPLMATCLSVGLLMAEVQGRAFSQFARRFSVAVRQGQSFRAGRRRLSSSKRRSALSPTTVPAWNHHLADLHDTRNCSGADAAWPSSPARPARLDAASCFARRRRHQMPLTTSSAMPISPICAIDRNRRA